MTIIQETERLHIRHIDQQDVDDMFAVYGDAESMRWVGDGAPLPRDGCAHWVDVTRTNYEKRGYGMSALVLKTTGEVVGFADLSILAGKQNRKSNMRSSEHFSDRVLRQRR